MLLIDAFESIEPTRVSACRKSIYANQVPLRKGTGMYR